MGIQINATDYMNQLLVEHTGVDDPSLIRLVLDVVEADLAKIAYRNRDGRFVIAPDRTQGTCIEVVL